MTVPVKRLGGLASNVLVFFVLPLVVTVVGSVLVIEIYGTDDEAQTLPTSTPVPSVSRADWIANANRACLDALDGSRMIAAIGRLEPGLSEWNEGHRPGEPMPILNDAVVRDIVYLDERYALLNARINDKGPAPDQDLRAWSDEILKASQSMHSVAEVVKRQPINEADRRQMINSLTAWDTAFKAHITTGRGLRLMCG